MERLPTFTPKLARPAKYEPKLKNRRRAGKLRKNPGSALRLEAKGLAPRKCHFPPIGAFQFLQNGYIMYIGGEKKARGYRGLWGPWSAQYMHAIGPAGPERHRRERRSLRVLETMSAGQAPPYGDAAMTIKRRARRMTDPDVG
jgi:hypothetical protein